MSSNSSHKCQLVFVFLLLSFFNLAHGLVTTGEEKVAANETTKFFSISFNVAPCLPPQGAPVPLLPGTFENWAGAIRVKNVWIAEPTTVQLLVDLVNWAYLNGYKIRPTGHMHGWVTTVLNSPPLPTSFDSLCPGGSNSRLILVRLTNTLTNLEMTTVPGNSPTPRPAVRCQCGAELERILEFLEANGFGITGVPAIGELSICGVLAIGGHGEGIAAKNETQEDGKTFGSFSNLVTTLTAVVWNETTGLYNLKEFSRASTETKAFLVTLGRAMIVEVTLRVTPNFNLRCQSFVDIPIYELLANPATVTNSTRTMSKLIDESGRVEIVLSPYTVFPWVKVWSLTPEKPFESREVTMPYNYPFADNIPKPVSDVLNVILTGGWSLAPGFGAIQYVSFKSGLAATLSYDLWGKSKNVQLYTKPSTLREQASGFAVLTCRNNIQQVLFETYSYFNDILVGFVTRGLYPFNGALEIRVSGADVNDNVTIAGAESPSISALNPFCAFANTSQDADNAGGGRGNAFQCKAFDVMVWFNILSFPGTPHANEMYKTMEDFLFRRFRGSDGCYRPEWTKGWAYSLNDAWDDPFMLQHGITQSFGTNWNFYVQIMDKYDPHRLFTNDFVDKFARIY